MLVNMNEILLPAQKGKYGVGFFNAVNVEMARAVIETAEELCAPDLQGQLADKYPDCDVDLQAGGQPLYYYLIAVE